MVFTVMLCSQLRRVFSRGRERKISVGFINTARDVLPRTGIEERGDDAIKCELKGKIRGLAAAGVRADKKLER